MTTFTKGHGTQNDFVLILDQDGTGDLSAEQVVALTHRRSGIGADGVIRVVPTRFADEPQVRQLADSASWFMDYRNADGSIGEMCGNGSRVFAAYLMREGLERSGEFAIATRAGLKVMRRIDAQGYVFSVDLGQWTLTDPDTAGEKGYDCLVTPRGGRAIPALSIDVGSMHTVVMLPEEITLDQLDLSEPPMVVPAPADGSNVEFVKVIGPGHIAMRVHERGVGETNSCGTGASAAAAATQWWAGGSDGSQEWIVDVTGGRLTIRLDGQQVHLEGPAALVADGETTVV